MQIAPTSDDLSRATRMAAIKLGSMTASGRKHFLQRWLPAVLVLSITFCPTMAVQAWPWGGDHSSTTARSSRNVDASAPTGPLQEVSPPGGVQQLQQVLNRHEPHLSLISPSDGSLLKNHHALIELQVEDWPLAEDPQLGLGAHVALQIDDEPPLRFSHASNGRLTIDLPDLSPGSHRFSAYAAMPWGEAVKSPGASLQWRLDVLQELIGTQPEHDAPWLAVVSPSEWGRSEPLLIDWLIWNAPLQNLREGDGRWRLRISVNGDSFLVDRQDALWLKGVGNSGVQMELLDGMGEPINPVFNNQFRAPQPISGSRPIWMQSKLSDEQVARLLGEALPEPPQPTQEEIVIQTDQTAAAEAMTDSASPANKKLSLEPESVALDNDAISLESQPEPSTDREQDTPDPPADPSSAAEQPNSTLNNEPKTSALSPAPEETSSSNAPSTSLGGSARELLKSDGTQR